MRFPKIKFPKNSMAKTRAEKNVFKTPRRNDFNAVSPGWLLSLGGGTFDPLMAPLAHTPFQVPSFEGLIVWFDTCQFCHVWTVYISFKVFFNKDFFCRSILGTLFSRNTKLTQRVVYWVNFQDAPVILGRIFLHRQRKLPPLHSMYKWMRNTWHLQTAPPVRD